MTLGHMFGILFTGIGIGIALGGILVIWYLEGKASKLWRISQAVKLQRQNDLAGLQQFYDYVKGVVGEQEPKP